MVNAMLVDQLNDRQNKAMVFMGMVLACCVAAYMTWRLSVRLDQQILAGLLIIVMAELALVAPKTAIFLTCVYLPINGDLRRILLYSVGRMEQDPLLLVGPAVLAVLFLGLLVKGKLNYESGLSRMIFWLSALMILHVFNPLQGGLMVGLVGLFLFLVPLTWYWVGQYYGSEKLIDTLLIRVMVPVAIVASAYSIYLGVFGIFEFQQFWLEQSGMWRHNLGSAVRPMGFFSSSQEMSAFAGAALIVLWAAFLKRRDRKLAVFIPVLFVGVVLQGSRGPIVRMIFSCCLIWALSGKTMKVIVSRFVFALAIGFSGLIYSLMHVDSIETPASIAPILAHHQKGILNVGESTAGAHASMTVFGVIRGIVINPIGAGIGSTTLAAGDSGVGNMEVDFSNLFMSLGILGGFLYSAILFSVFKKAYRYWKVTNNFVSVALIGVLSYWFGTYLVGMCYSIVVISWLLIGSMERIVRDESIEYGFTPKRLERHLVKARLGAAVNK